MVELPELRVGDRVLVVSGGSRYKGQYGILVSGPQGTGCMTSSRLSAYVEFESGGVPFSRVPQARLRQRTVRCSSLQVIGCGSTVAARGHQGIPTCPDLGSKATPIVERLRVLCDELEALALHADAAADQLIVEFSADVLADYEQRKPE